MQLIEFDHKDYNKCTTTVENFVSVVVNKDDCLNPRVITL